MTLQEVVDRVPTEAEISAEMRATAIKTLKSRALQEHMQLLFAEVETRTNQKVDRVTMNAKNYRIVRDGMKDILDIETRAVNLKKGIMGRLWGARVVVSRHAGEPRCCLEIPPGYVQIWQEETV